MPTFSLPTPDAVRDFGAPPDAAEVIAWDGTGDPPAGAERIGMFVGRYDAPPPPREVFAALPQLQVIQLVSAGVEPWLPVVPDGVVLCNGRGIHGASTAELGFAGLLSLLRDLPEYAQAQRAHQWKRLGSSGLDGSRVLVLGAGDIGDRVATAARAFGARTTLVARTARDGVETLDRLPDLLPDHAAVVIALPLTPETTGLVDRDFLAAMPDGAVLVNVARGRIVDTDALLHELQARRLRAFLDVTDPEPLPAEHPLWDAPNLLLTPHVGGGTRGWESRAYRGLVHDQVQRWIDGDALINRVEHGY